MTRAFQKTQCRICGNKHLIPVLNLGSLPLANSFVTKRALKRHEARFPLAVQLCSECSLLSLRHVIDPRILFKNYRYLTGASIPLVAHFEEEAKMIARRYIRDKDDLVVEFGSNDGALLSALKGRCRVLGVDPAKNLSALATRRGVPTVTAFWGEETARRIQKKYGQAKVIVANNVFAHIDDLHDCMRAVSLLLRDDGVFISESHWVGNLIGEGGFDQIYHEHLSYYSLHALARLARAHGLIIGDAALVPIHGESLRVSMKKHGTPRVSVQRLLLREQKIGLTRPKVFREFATKVEKNRRDLQCLLKELKNKEKTIAGYGAPAKGNTLLNYFKIGPDTLDFITDTTLTKQGLYTPGTQIPILSPNALRRNPPDYLLLLAWNYVDAILKKEKSLRAKGVKFIIPVPEVRVV